MFKKKMKQIGAMAMAASMILASVQLPPLAANAAENTNLALSATATASNSEGGNEIAKINDGNMNTRWSHDQSNTSWAQLAWAESKTMKSFVINWQRNNAVNYNCRYLMMVRHGEMYTLQHRHRQRQRTRLHWILQLPENSCG